MMGDKIGYLPDSKASRTPSIHAVVAYANSSRDSTDQLS
jgi:hypothetical protein